MRGVASLVGLLAALLACGAASTREFRLADVSEDEAVIAGRLRVRYNGVESTKDCSLCFVGDDCTLVNEQGFAFHRVPRGHNAFKQIRCNRDGSWYHYTFEGQGFAAYGQGTVTYFGDLFIDWKTEGGYKGSEMFGLAGVAADEASNDGQATIAVMNNPAHTLAALAQQVGRQLPPVVSLVGSLRTSASAAIGSEATEQRHRAKASKSP